MPAASRLPSLPCPGVRLDAALRTRAARFAARVSAARGRREGAARAGLAGAGLEFDHYRPYRPGDDLRSLDWDVYARSEQAVVRVARPEAGERWAILIDSSASMGVGPPGKLQRAAECALALARLALRVDATARLVDLRGEGAARFEFTRSAEAEALADWLEARTAAGRLESPALEAAFEAARAAERLWLLSDFLDPLLLDSALARPGRTRAHWIGLLAPLELAPEERGPVRWLDAESEAELALEVDERALAIYAREREAARERLARAAARRGALLCQGSSAEDFEALLQRVLRP